jgi:hypothetical protein
MGDPESLRPWAEAHLVVALFAGLEGPRFHLENLLGGPGEIVFAQGDAQHALDGQDVDWEAAAP